MKLLAALMTCALDAERGYHDAIRSTWGSDAVAFGMDLKFFIGKSSYIPKVDEVRLDVPDNKETLLYKVVAMCEWALAYDYDYMLKVNTNTYIDVQKLATLPPLNGKHADYAGAQVGKIHEPYGEMGIHGWMQGAASWLSAKAMRIVHHDAIKYAHENMARLMPWNGIIAPYLHSEDLWIGQALHPYLNELTVSVNEGYGNGPVSYWSQSGYIKCYCLSEWMKAMHHSQDKAKTLAEYRSKG